VLTHPLCVGDIETDARKALAEAASRYPRHTLHNGAGDAFRHCYWSALMTRDMGFLNTKAYTDAHEDYEGNPPDEKAMDTHNNLQGMVIGIRGGRGASDRQLADACSQALNQGKLKTLQ
jgi:hypothetical protein